MWGRELRAGMVFVVASLVLGGAFRAWERTHEQRFAEIVESLVERDAASGSGNRPGLRGEDGDSVRFRAGEKPDSEEGRAARSRRSRPVAAALRAESIDVDDASASELVRLPGIGPALAARIVADRAAHGRFGGPKGLLRVPGIGPKTLAKILPYLTSPAESWNSSTGPADTSRAK